MKKWIGLLFLSATLVAFISYANIPDIEKQYPPIGTIANINGTGISLHYSDSGPRQAQAIVLVHGASTNLQDFQASLSQPLQAKFRVIAIDRHGHGYSERLSGEWAGPDKQARLIYQLLQQLGISKPIIVGHSWAGSVVLAYLLAYPDETTGGVLLAGASHPWKGGVAWYNYVAGVPLFGALFANTALYSIGKSRLDDAVREVFEPNSAPEGYIQQTAVELSLRPDEFLANAEDLRRLSDFLAQQSQRYQEITRPVLLITGDVDVIVPAWNHTDRLIDILPNTQRVVLENTGHALHHVHTKRIADMISEFANQHGS